MSWDESVVKKRGEWEGEVAESRQNLSPDREIGKAWSPAKRLRQCCDWLSCESHVLAHKAASLKLLHLSLHSLLLFPFKFTQVDRFQHCKMALSTILITLYFNHCGRPDISSELGSVIPECALWMRPCPAAATAALHWHGTRFRLGRVR